MNVKGNSSDANESNEVNEQKNLFVSLSAPPVSAHYSFADGDKLCSFSLYQNLQTFDPQRNVWSEKVLKVDEPKMSMEKASTSSTFDPDGRIIWNFVEDCQNFSHQLFRIGLDANEITDVFYQPINQYRLRQKIYRPIVVAVEDKLHMVGTDFWTYDLIHIVVNRNDLSVVQHVSDSVQTGTSDWRLHCDGLIHFETTDALYLFAFGEGVRGTSDRNLVLCYGNGLRIWKGIKAQKRRSTGGIAFDRACYVGIDLSIHRQYVIVFGQSEFMIGDRINKIVVYDVQQNVFRKCSIRLPLSCDDEVYDAVVIRGRNEEKVTVFGYIRRLYNTAAFEGLTAVPLHIMELVSQWVRIDYVHIIAREYYIEQYHFRIAVNDILQSLQ